MSIGEKIKSLRKASGKSQEDLAMALGVSRQTINKWEADKTQPNIENIMTLCSVFEVNSDYFLGAVSKDTENEVAASAELNKKASKKKVLIALSVVIGVLFVIGAFASIILGMAVFSSNTGDEVVVTDGIDIADYGIILSLSVLSLVAEIVLLVFILKKQQK